MKRNRMSKLSASLIVLVMAISALVMLPTQSLGQPASTSNIYVPVVSGGPAVIDAWVNLTNVHTGAVIAAQYWANKSAYAVANAPSGYYRVDVVHPNYYDSLDASEFKFDGFSNYTASLIQLTPFPYKGYVWNITVRDPSNQPFGAGVAVGFYDPVNREFVAKELTNSLSYATVSMFGTSVLGDVDLIIMKSGFETYVEQVLVNSDITRTINLANHKLVSSYITDANGPATNAVSYLINTDQSVPWVKRVLRSFGPAMAFDAYAGDFILVVDADGDASHVQAVNVTTSDIALTINLAAQPKRTEQVSIVYGADYSAFSLSVDTQWSYDDAYPGLMLKDMGSLRMQVDLLLGNGDGTLSAGEVSAFYSKVNSFGSQYASSSGLLVVNDTVYGSAASITGYTMDLASGTVLDTTGVHYAYSCQYTAHGSIDVGAPSYSASAYVRYDSNSVDYRYSIGLVGNYELVANSSSGLVVVSGYTTIDIDPKISGSGTGESVALTLEESLRPVAKAKVLDSAYAYAVFDADGVNVTEYIVAISQNVTLSVSGSEDPNGNPLTFNWTFGDGGYNLTRDSTVIHQYLTAAVYTVNLTVIDVVGLENWTEITVVGDWLDPTPVITVKDKVVNTTDNSIAINQREVVIFNATSSTDDAISAGDAKGVIDHVQFEWGDGNISDRVQWTSDQQNVSHAYERSGTYNLTLNVTDVVGHWKNTTLLVKVNDTQIPTVTFVVRNETWGTNLVENKTLSFDANGTTDNVDSLYDLYFSWDFDDGTWFNGTGAEGAWNVTHMYNKTGSFDVRLNVTDKSGNFKVDVRLTTVVAGPRPNMLVDNIYYDPLTFTEGKAGYIIVNMTNKGSANATNIQLSFYIVTADGKQKSLTGTGTLTLNGTLVTTVTPGQQVQYKFLYTPSSKGTYTIRVNVTSDNQLRPTSFTTPDNDRLPVNQAAWKQYVLWAGVIVVIVLFPLLLYLRGRLSKREKKGPRREKKEKASDEEL